MDKRKNHFTAREYLDSRRVKEAFFTAPPVRKAAPVKLKPKKKPYLAIAGVVLLLISGVFFSLKYTLIPVSNHDIHPGKKLKTILTDPGTAKFSFTPEGRSRVKTKRGVFFLEMQSQDSISLKIIPTRSLDLSRQMIVIYLKKNKNPFKIEVTVKDTDYHSNVQKPVIVTSRDTGDFRGTEYVVEFDQTLQQNIDLRKIKQINLRFSSPSLDSWIVLKDIFLAEKSS